MFNFYWVNGAGNTDDVSHYSLTSGGSAGVSLPTLADNIILDSNSGLSGKTVNIGTSFASTLLCRNFTSTVGSSYTITQSVNSNGINCYGSMTLESFLTASSIRISMYSTTPGNTFTQNGATLNLTYLDFGQNDNAGAWALSSDLIMTGEFDMERGTFNANGYNVTATNFYFYSDDTFTSVVKMGTGTWTATGNDTSPPGTQNVWVIDQYTQKNINFVPNGSDIKFTNAGAISYGDYFNGTLQVGATLVTNSLYTLSYSGGNYILSLLSHTTSNAKIDENDKPVLTAYNNTTSGIESLKVDPILNTLEIYGVVKDSNIPSTLNRSLIDANENSTLLGYNETTGLVEAFRCGSGGELLITQ